MQAMHSWEHNLQVLDVPMPDTSFVVDLANQCFLFDTECSIPFLVWSSCQLQPSAKSEIHSDVKGYGKLEPVQDGCLPDLVRTAVGVAFSIAPSCDGRGTEAPSFRRRPSMCLLPNMLYRSWSCCSTVRACHQCGFTFSTFECAVHLRQPSNHTLCRNQAWVHSIWTTSRCRDPVLP